MALRAFFTGKVDRQYAWIGNDAAGGADVLAQVASLINSAATSVAVSSMTFSYKPGATPADAQVEQIAGLLADKAAAGVEVRIVGNAGHRFQAGYFRAQRGPVMLADNNLPALVCRISFQRAASPAPAGCAVDSGQPFGANNPALPAYGWDADASGQISAHADAAHPIPPSFTSPLLRECYAQSNGAAPRTWKIQLPAGHYYVLAAAGEAAYSSKSFIAVQGDYAIFLGKTGGVCHYADHTDNGAGEFSCSTVDGGTDPDTGLPMAKRFEVVAGGCLELTVGKPGQTSYTSLDYLEIYRASDIHPYGDPGLDKALVQERALHHSKFVLVDAATPAPRLWTGSHNLTPVDPAAAGARSEDAIWTDDPAICGAFAQEFNQWWGAPGGLPNSAASRLGLFKIPVIAGGLTPGVRPGTTAAWQVRFSPSTHGAPGLDMFAVTAGFLDGAADEILILVEQVTSGGSYNGFTGPTALITRLRDKALAGKGVRGLVGNTAPGDAIFTELAGLGTAKIGPCERVHDKCACADTLRDNPARGWGKVLSGSMNWSQSALHVNDEQTLIVEDPALANQFLQRAAAAFADNAIALARAADCVVVIDRSYSMNQPAAAAATKLEAAKAAARVFVDLLDPSRGHRVALVRFGASVEEFVPSSTLAPLTPGSAAFLHTAINGIAATLPVGNWTCYGLALDRAHSLLTGEASPNPRQLVVFLSDGLENMAPMASGFYPDIARHGIEIHTTSLGLDGQRADAILTTMAEFSGGSFAHVQDDALELQKRFADVARDAQGLIVISDPGWTLRPGEAFEHRFPVDLRAGVLEVVVLWGGQPDGPAALGLKAPWGALNRRSPGVERIRAAGHEIWRVDLARLAAKPRREVRGFWTLWAQAPAKGEGLLALEACVYASDTGLARCVAAAEPMDAPGRAVRFRVWAGRELAGEFTAQLVHTPPPGADGKRPRPAVLKAKPLRSTAPGWRGVHETVVASAAPGIHEVRIVVEGQASVQEPGRGRKPLVAPFRREQVLRWFQKE